MLSALAMTVSVMLKVTMMVTVMLMVTTTLSVELMVTFARGQDYDIENGYDNVSDISREVIDLTGEISSGASDSMQGTIQMLAQTQVWPPLYMRAYRRNLLTSSKRSKQRRKTCLKSLPMTARRMKTMSNQKVP